MDIVAREVAVPPGPDTVMEYSVGVYKGPVFEHPSNLLPAKFPGVELITRFALVEIQHTTVDPPVGIIGSRGIMVTVGVPGGGSGGVPGGGVPGGGVSMGSHIPVIGFRI